jgi:polyisoprenoid-binding protein YceI
MRHADPIQVGLVRLLADGHSREEKLMTRSTSRPPGYVAGTWTIDSARSTVAFTIRHLLLHKVRGTFGAFTGQIVTGNEVTGSSVSAQIDLDSLDTGDAGRDKGTLAKDPFDIAHHPVMTYNSTGLAPDGQAWQLEGKLTLRGITHEVSLRVQQYEFTFGTTGERRARFFATGNINRQALGFGSQFRWIVAASSPAMPLASSC